MAGHSKWKNIQHRKGAQDAKRGKIFTKIAKEISVAAKLGGGDPDSNARLRLILTKARAANMPKDNIDRAIKRGTGEGDAINYFEKTYEGYGPCGVAVMVECLTDNVNRTVSEVRHAFSRSGGNLGTDGSVAWMFESKGILIYEKSLVKDYERLIETAIEHGADDIKEEDDNYEILCAPESFSELKEALDQLNLEASVAEVAKFPENLTSVEADKVEAVLRLIELLEDHDDVQNVYHNAELPDTE